MVVEYAAKTHAATHNSYRLKVAPSPRTRAPSPGPRTPHNPAQPRTTPHNPAQPRTTPHNPNPAR